jgi:hypothetical protein
MTYPVVPDDNEESEQTQEIKRILEVGPTSKGKSYIVPDEEWSPWEVEIQAQVDKLYDNDRLFRLGMIAIGGVSLCALVAAGLTAKAVTQLAMGMKALTDNQVELFNYLGQQGDALAGMVAPYGAGPDVTIVTKADLNGVDPTIDPDAVVAEPFMGPASEASEETIEQLKKDKEAGIISEFHPIEEPD